MLSKEMLHKEIDSLPDEFTDELYLFLRFLREKHGKDRAEATFLSESSLQKDWLNPEEDEAWRDL